MKWRAVFYAYYFGKKKVEDWPAPDHVFDPCPPPEQFFEQLFKGKGGYRKTNDIERFDRRWVTFESDSGEWHLFGVKEGDESGEAI